MPFFKGRDTVIDLVTYNRLPDPQNAHWQHKPAFADGGYAPRCRKKIYFSFDSQ